MDSNIIIEERKGQLALLFRGYFGFPCSYIHRIGEGGSDRIYFRISGEDPESGENVTAVGVIGADFEENRCFLNLSEIFRANDINVPEVYSQSDDCGCYLIEDLGDISFFSLIRDRGEEDPYIKDLLTRCMRELVNLQTIEASEWEGLVTASPFSRRQVMWDLNYFKYEYLKLSSVPFSEERLEDDFERLSEKLSFFPKELSGFMYRDCQSRNVMVSDGELYWIDYQGGRRGPCVYDAVSFLWQAKAGFSKKFRQRMLKVYADVFSEKRGVPADMILAFSRDMALFRTLQVLGAYGFRGLIEKRAHFIESIPKALANLKEITDDGGLSPYPELEKVCKSLVEDSRFIDGKEEKTLTVEIFSFSYKRGYPLDFSGNGGGFMFDCRALHNPGRYAEYKSLTGRDPEVKAFLENRKEVKEFLENSFALVDASVERFLARGFSKLQVGFGCTGGQHRSVYSADCLAEHIREKYPDVRIKLIHREQNF